MSLTTEKFLSCTRANFGCSQCGLDGRVVINGHWAHVVDFYSYLVDSINGDELPDFVRIDFDPLRELLVGKDDLDISVLEYRTGLPSKYIYDVAKGDGWAIRDGSANTFFLTRAPQKVARAKRGKRVKAVEIDLSETDRVYFRTSDVIFSATHSTITFQVGEDAYLLGKRKLLRRFLRRVKLDPKIWLKVEPEQLLTALSGVASKAFKIQVHNGMILSIKVAKSEEILEHLDGTVVDPLPKV